MKERKKNSTWSLTWIILQLAVVFSVFSQIESIEWYTRPAMYAVWAIVLMLGICKCKGKLYVDAFSQRFIIAYVLFCIYCILAGLVDSRHFSANYIRVLLVPLLVTIVGGMYADEDRALFNRLGILYLICSVVFALWVQNNYFPSYTSWLSTRTYLFRQKNSAGQIWVTAILISVLLIDFKTKTEKILIYIASAYLLFMTGICQCRTALLGLGVSVLFFAISKAKNKTKWIVLIASVAMITWLIPTTRQFIKQALFLNKYAGADLNTFSSGRLVTYSRALQLFATSPIIGVGKYYVDSSYILILTESGIVGFILIEWVWIKKLIQNYLFHGIYFERIFLLMMTTFYVVESILEGYPPFGPGVSSFMFWFTGSVIINREDKYEEQGCT